MTEKIACKGSTKWRRCMLEILEIPGRWIVQEIVYPKLTRQNDAHVSSKKKHDIKDWTSEYAWQG